MSKTKIPNVVRGGVAIPLGRNLYYMKGRKHSQGGIDIGKNPRTGLEVEDGEIIQMKPKELRVLSAQKGIGTGNTSPAQAVLNGANPDKIFQAQENFKDRNGINDDGTKAKLGIKETLRKLFPNIAKAYDYITKDNDKKINISESKTINKKTGQLPYGYTLRNLYKFENPDRKGIKRNIAYPYDSRTIGPGIDFKSGHPELAKKAKKGIPLQDVNDSAVIHLRKDDEVIMSNYADIYGQASADTVSHGPRFLAAQARYQQGNIRKAFPEIAEAMNKGDAKALKKAVLKVTPKDHKYRRQLVQDYEVYPSKKSDGGMIQINGNVKNGLIYTPRPKQKCGGRRKAGNGTQETVYDNLKKIGNEQLAFQDSIDNGYYIETDTGFIRNPNLLNDVIITANVNSNDGGIDLFDESIPRVYQGKGAPIPDYLKRSSIGVIDNDKIRRQEAQNFVDRFTVKNIIPQTKNNSNIKIENKGSKEINTNPSSTGKQTQTTTTAQTSNAKQTSSTGTSNTPRKGTTSVKPNTYSVTNYVIQKNGSVKADGVRTGSGFKQYEKRKNQQTISDAKVSKSWRETIGDDADILNYIANGDAFEHKRWQDRHSKMSQETGYNPKSGRAIKHEDVRQYSKDFNNKFNQANKKLGLYTTPAGKTGDNFYGDTKKCGGRKRAKDGLQSPYEDDWYGAQVALRTLGNNLSREDMKYLQEQIDTRRQAPTRRAAFIREDGYAGVIDELQAPKINPINIAKPTIDLSPISKTVVPKAQKRAILKGTVRDKFNEGPTLGDWIGAGVNLAAGLGDFFGTNAYLNRFKSPDLRLQPHLKLKTYYNNNAEIDEINRNVENISRDIDVNTASSSTALARKINARNNATMAKNKSWQNKFNIQDERINTERKLNSNIDGRNADRFNRWSIQDAAINNAKYQAKANNLGNLMGNISGTVNDVIARIEARRNFNNNLGYIQGANPNVDDRIYEDTGVQFDPRRRRYINTQKGITFMARCGKRIKLK